jgi:type I restriction enzyme M protein
MGKFFNIEEAANYLELTPQTLRNWDKSGKINCIREPGNNYRLFSKEELDSIKNTVKPKIRRHSKINLKEIFELKSDTDLKRLISKLHRIIRDIDGRSSIIERFDELTKLLLLHLSLNGSLSPLGQDEKSFARMVRKSYALFLSQTSLRPPKNFEKINLNNQCIFSLFDYLCKFNLNSISGDIKGLIYEEMIKDIFEKGDNQQFFTPKTVVNFMAGIINSLASGSICDPASGTGGFLINLAKNKTSSFKKFTALEIDGRLSWISGMNLKIHGCKNYESFCLPKGGTLGKEANKYKSSFDAIITNPPFGSDYSDSEGLRKFKLGAGKSSRRRGVLFIERCLEFLKGNGYLAIIIDDGVLNHPSNQDVRELIIGSSELIAVISLPITAFMPYASVEASILILKKAKRPNRKIKTFFAIAENVGKKNNGNEDYTYESNGVERLNNDLVTIQEKWKRHVKGKKITNSHACYLTNIFDTFRTNQAHCSRIDFSFHHYSREIVRTALEKHGNKLVRLSEVCREVNEPLIPAKELSDQTILYTGLANIESNSEVYSQTHTPTNSLKSTVKRYQKGDVLFSKMRPNLRKSIVVNHVSDGYCSSECVVFRPNHESISGRLLSAILRSDFVYGQIVHLITGIGRPRVSVRDLRTILIPAPSIAKTSEALKIYVKNMKKVNDLKIKAAEIGQQSIDLQNKSINDVVNQLLI